MFEEPKLPENSSSCSTVGKSFLSMTDTTEQECYSSIVWMSKPANNRNIHFPQKQMNEIQCTHRKELSMVTRSGLVVFYSHNIKYKFIYCHNPFTQVSLEAKQIHGIRSQRGASFPGKIGITGKDNETECFNVAIFLWMPGKQRNVTRWHLIELLASDFCASFIGLFLGDHAFKSTYLWIILIQITTERVSLRIGLCTRMQKRLTW